jgi:hypothetical protein
MNMNMNVFNFYTQSPTTLPYGKNFDSHSYKGST